MEWEVSLIEWSQKSLGSLHSAVGTVLSFLGGEIGLMLVLLIVLFCWKKESGKRLALIIAAVNTWLPMIKAAVTRLRPYMEYPDRVKGVADAGNRAPLEDVAAHGYSFPSTHSASAMALFIPLAREVRKKWMWIAAVLITFLVGVSRAVNGMHYPTDILAGWALGLAGAGICLLLEKKVKNEWVRHLILLASVLPGLFFVRTEDYYTSLGLLTGLIAAIHFEKKFVNFRDTRNIWAMILRVLGAFAIYYVLNTLLKLPFSREFLSGGTMGAFLIRSARYSLIIFTIIGIYPMAFPLFEKIRKKN
ncbi:MAG: phosphatase PAP2 family protein [Clostridiales bacterium]|nr:phosphatase PAP2 family protein [Clostridiales bacterium]